MQIKQIPSVTAIVPTCDRPHLLERALRSVLAQDFRPKEIMVVDDTGNGHEHVTRQALQRYGSTGLRVVANANAKGVSGARNTGAELATGDIVAFLDDDDEWLPSYLNQAVDAFIVGTLDVLCADLLCRFDDGIDRPSKSAPETLRSEVFLTRNPGLVGSNIIIKRTLYLEIGGFDESLPACNDMDFGIRLSLRGDVKYERLPERLVRIYQHNGPKLGGPKSEAMRKGVRRFYKLHAHRMSPAQREAFRRNMRTFWAVDEQGALLNGDPALVHESLLLLLKAWLDGKRSRRKPKE
jgi:glycosyltransferase involved in cell wall biosynthesis